MYTISDEKLTEVTAIINNGAQPSATSEEVFAFITSDWPEGEEHQQWLDSANASEIANWIVACVWS